MRATVAWMILLVLAPLCSRAQSADEQAPLIVEGLQCEGNQSFSCRSILGYLYLGVGDRLNEEEIQNAKLRLSWLHHFDSVDIYLAKGSARGRVRVIVKVSEAKPIATQVDLGLQAPFGNLAQAFVGRLVHDDLFGTGKILDLQVSALAPLSRQAEKYGYESLQYIDPHLFESTRYFMSTGIAHLDDYFERDNGDRYDAHLTIAQLAVGRRLGEFSYFTAGYTYRPELDVVYRRRQGNGEFTTDTATAHGALLLGYGWTTDDPLFPTQGSILQVNLIHNVGAPGGHSAFFLKTWPVGAAGFLSVSAQSQSVEARAFGVTYAHRISHLDGSGELRRARWYVEPTYGTAGYNSQGTLIREFGLRAGLRLDAKRFGIVNFYGFGSTAWHQGNSR